MTMRNMIHNCIKLLIWIPVLVTGILITSFSAQNGTQSSGLSRKVAQTFIQGLENGHVISVESNDQREVLIGKMQYPIRKGAHMTEYAIFTVFTYIALLTDGVRLPKRRYFCPADSGAVSLVRERISGCTWAGAVVSKMSVLIR